MNNGQYRIGCDGLLDRLGIWDGYLHRKVHLIACGGTAMTLLGVKDSTKDIDLIVPELKEYSYLTRTLNELGYIRDTGYGWRIPGDNFIFDIFAGNSVYMTELRESPLKEGNHTVYKEFSSIYLGVLNEYDLISSKLLRGTQVDIDDCHMLMEYRGEAIDKKRLHNVYRDYASYQLNPEKANRTFDLFIEDYKEG